MNRHLYCGKTTNKGFLFHFDKPKRQNQSTRNYLIEFVFLFLLSNENRPVNTIDPTYFGYNWLIEKNYFTFNLFGLMILYNLTSDD